MVNIIERKESTELGAGSIVIPIEDRTRILRDNNGRSIIIVEGFYNNKPENHWDSVHAIDSELEKSYYPWSRNFWDKHCWFDDHDECKKKCKKFIQYHKKEYSNIYDEAELEEIEDFISLPNNRSAKVIGFKLV